MTLGEFTVLVGLVALASILIGGSLAARRKLEEERRIGRELVRLAEQADLEAAEHEEYWKGYYE